MCAMRGSSRNGGQGPGVSEKSPYKEMGLSTPLVGPRRRKQSLGTEWNGWTARQSGHKFKPWFGPNDKRDLRECMRCGRRKFTVEGRKCTKWRKK